MEAENDQEHVPQVHTIDLSVKIPSKSEDMRDVSNNIFVLTQKVELMSKEFENLRRNELASLKMDVRHDMASLAPYVTSLKEAF